MKPECTEIAEKLASVIEEYREHPIEVAQALWALVEKRPRARGPSPENAISFLDGAERDLAAVIEDLGTGLDNLSGEHWTRILEAAASSWKNVRFARRELDPGAWERYRPTCEGPSEAREEPRSESITTPEDVSYGLEQAQHLLDGLVRHAGPDLAQVVVCDEVAASGQLGVEVGMLRNVNGLEVVSRALQQLAAARANLRDLAGDEAAQ